MGGGFIPNPTVELIAADQSVNTCINIYIFVYMYACMIHTFKTFIHACIHIYYIHAYVLALMLGCAYEYINTYARVILARTCTPHIHVCMHDCLHTGMYT